jgi:hypothetical protein
MKWVVVLITFLNTSPMPNWVFGIEWYDNRFTCMEVGAKVAQSFRAVPNYKFALWNCVDINTANKKGDPLDKKPKGTSGTI